MKTIKSLKDSGLLTKGLTEDKEQKEGLLSMLAATLGASLLGNMLIGKGILRAGKRTIRTSQSF